MLEYVVMAIYAGPISLDLDSEIVRAAGRKATGAGYDLERKERDITFGFKRRAAARSAATRIRRRTGVRVRIDTFKF